MKEKLNLLIELCQNASKLYEDGYYPKHFAQILTNLVNGLVPDKGEKLDELAELCEKASGLYEDGYYPRNFGKTLANMVNDILAKHDEEKWITTENGKHIQIESETGEILKGNIGQGGSSRKGDNRISEALRPRDDYDMEGVYDHQTFIHKNVEKLRPIYKAEGGRGIDDEMLRVQLNRSNGSLKPMEEAEADEELAKNISQGDFDGWFREANSEYKPRIVEAVTSSPEARNASLNRMYINYKQYLDLNGQSTDMDFETFLTTPVTMYRGGSGQKHTEDDVFSSYSFDRKIAEGFGSNIYEAKIRPIDTFGSVSRSGESEIMVPRMIAPNGEKDSRDDGEDTHHGCGVVIVKDGKFLVGTRMDNGLVCSAGGHIQDDETDEEGAIRETQEEFGITPKDLKELDADTSGIVGQPTFYLCSDYEGEVDTDDKEMTNPRFLTLEELGKEKLYVPFRYAVEHLLRNVFTNLVDRHLMNDDAEEPKQNNNNNQKKGGGEKHGNTRLPYGLCKGKGIDTTGMSPREAWEALKGEYGVKPKEEYKKLKERNQKPEGPMVGSGGVNGGTVGGGPVAPPAPSNQKAQQKKSRLEEGIGKIATSGWTGELEAKKAIMDCPIGTKITIEEDGIPDRIFTRTEKGWETADGLTESASDVAYDLKSLLNPRWTDEAKGRLKGVEVPDDYSEPKAPDTFDFKAKDFFEDASATSSRIEEALSKAKDGDVLYFKGFETCIKEGGIWQTYDSSGRRESRVYSNTDLAEKLSDFDSNKRTVMTYSKEEANPVKPSDDDVKSHCKWGDTFIATRYLGAMKAGSSILLDNGSTYVKRGKTWERYWSDGTLAEKRVPSIDVYRSLQFNGVDSAIFGKAEKRSVSITSGNDVTTSSKLSDATDALTSMEVGKKFEVGLGVGRKGYSFEKIDSNQYMVTKSGSYGGVSMDKDRVARILVDSNRIASGIEPTLANYEDARAEWIKNSGSKAPSEENQKKVSAKMTELFNSSDTLFASRVNAYNLEDILRDGLKNQFETHSSEGYYSPKTRADMSTTLFGTEQLICENKDYEKYGYVASHEALMTGGVGSRTAHGYGNVVLSFKKDNMKGRATYTFGDSLDDRYHRGMAGMIGDTVDWVGASYLGRGDGNVDQILNAKSVTDLPVSYYCEMQYHGQVTAKDIDTIYADQYVIDNFSDETKRMLSENGIKVLVKG